jgi:hypothetical protein
MITRLMLLAFVCCATAACARNWNLEVTEVGTHEVELYLNQPATDSFSLRGMTLSWEGHPLPAGSGMQPGPAPGGAVDLGVLATNLNGGQFLVIWEGNNGYTGPPVSEEFSGGQLGRVPGIKVSRNFFDMIDQAPAIVRVSGSRVDGLVVTHKVSDTVCFGLPEADRPAGCASFASTGQMTSPTGSAGPQRIWDGSAPKDTNSEADWTFDIHSWGVPTPP